MNKCLYVYIYIPPTHSVALRVIRFVSCSMYIFICIYLYIVRQPISVVVRVVRDKTPSVETYTVPLFTGHRGLGRG